MAAMFAFCRLCGKWWVILPTTFSFQGLLQLRRKKVFNITPQLSGLLIYMLEDAYLIRSLGDKFFVEFFQYYLRHYVYIQSRSKTIKGQNIFAQRKKKNPSFSLFETWSITNLGCLVAWNRQQAKETRFLKVTFQ